MLLHHTERNNSPEEAAQFKVIDCFTYLGIQIVPYLEHIVETKYRPVVHEISFSR